MTIGTPQYRRYVMLLLTTAYMVSLADRSLLIILVEPIKRDLSLTDLQIGLLTGFAFAGFYAVVGIPIARVADRGHRVNIAALALGLWAVTMMSFVMVTSYVQLLIARVATAIGESGCKPPTYSLLGDYFPQAGERARAMSVYAAGSSVGALVTIMIGGWLNDHYGWRVAFLLFGLPGLLLAIVFKATVKETRDAHAATSVPQPSLLAIGRELASRAASRHLIIAFILIMFCGAGMSPWYAAFLIRSHGMSTTELGLWLGPTMTLGALSGIMLGGYLAARLHGDDERAQIRLGALMFSLTMPLTLAFLFSPSKYIALACLFPLFAAFSFFLGPTYALLQRLVPPAARATALALVMLVAHLIGSGAGPLVIGAMSDGLHSTFGTGSLRCAMMVASAVAPWGAFHLWKMGNTARRDIDEVAHDAGSALGAMLPPASQTDHSR